MKVGGCIKSTEILHVLDPNFLGGELPEFLESIYKIDTGFDHVAKFRGYRPRELGDLAAKKKKHHEHFIRPPVTPYGRPNKVGSAWDPSPGLITEAGNVKTTMRQSPSAAIGRPTIYRVTQKMARHYFTVRISRKFIIILSLKIPPHSTCVSTLPCEMSVH